MQAAYDDVLERLKGQSSELLAALGGGLGSAGSTDEAALSQVGHEVSVLRSTQFPYVVDRHLQMRQAHKPRKAVVGADLCAPAVVDAWPHSCAA